MAEVKKKTRNPDRTIKALAAEPKEISPGTVADLRPSGYNPRTITNDEARMLNGSLREFGDIGLIIFNRRTGRLVGGHQRTKLLDPTWPIVKEAHTDELGTVAKGYIDTPFGHMAYREVDWDEQKEHTANIAANKMGGSFDEDLLSQLLQDLQKQGADLDLTGFMGKELDDLLKVDQESELGEEDPETEPVADPFVKFGDLWLLGESRLLCGDSTKLTDIEKLMQGEKAHLSWQDPPYNIAYETKAGKIDNDNLKPAAFMEFLLAAFAMTAYALRPGACFYIAHAEGGGVGDAFRAAICGTKDLMWKQCLIWVKNAATLVRSDFNNKHEPILYGWKQGACHYFAGDHTQTTVIDDDLDLSKLDKRKLIELLTDKRNAEPTTVIRVDKPNKSLDHPTVKPIRLIERCIRSSTRPGEIVIDQFSGSGSTIITCRKTGRKGRGLEYTPGYTQASLLRYRTYCNEEPLLLLPDGKTLTYTEVEKQRKHS